MPRSLAICLALALATLCAYSRALKLDFVEYDDPFFVIENETVNGGLTTEGLRRAFTTTHHGQWQPASWTSHMLDVELFGLEPAGHHATSVALHVLNVLLVFGLVLRLAGRRAPAAFVALLFAVHPLHVESVAWVSSRKDLVSLLFGLLALWLHAGHRGGSLLRAPGRLAGVATLHALALMGKPMLVTLPCAMLLLDAWPLGRWRLGPEAVAGGPRPRLGLGALVAEKLPLFALSAAAAWIARSAVHAEGQAPDLGLGARAANAVVSIARYLRKAALPTDLAPAYPHPSLTAAGGWPWWQVALAALVVAAGFALAAWAWPRRAWATVGWLWFVGTLVPVLGLASLSGHAMADRYAYLPMLGVDLAAVFTVVALVDAGRAPRAWSAAAGLALAAALAWTTHAQTAHWRGTEALWRHAIEVADDNYVAHANLGRHLMERGDHAGAARHYVAALRAKPDLAEPLSNLGVLHELRGELEHAEGTFRRALALDPGDDTIRANLANVVLQRGRPAEARELLEDVVLRRPDDPRVLHALGLALARTGEPDAGLARLRRAVELEPASAPFRDGLARALIAAGRPAEAALAFRRALELDPELFEARVNLALALRAAGDVAGARRAFEDAAARRPDEALVRVQLGALLVDVGELEAAAEHLAAGIALGDDTADVNALLGFAEDGLRRFGRAARHHARAAELAPDVAAHQNNLGGALWRSGDLAGASAAYRRAVELDPTFALAFANLGLLQQALGDLTSAIASHRRALELDPDLVASAESLAWILATSPVDALRDGAEAVRLAERALELGGEAPLRLTTVAAAYAEVGRFEDAVAAQERALVGMPAHRLDAQTARLELYRARRPYRDRPLDERER